MAIELSTAGILFGYAAESTAGTMPSAFTKIAGAKSLPDLSGEPSALETTPLDATEWKTYIAGLKDAGGTLSITFNMTEAFSTAWSTLCTAYDTAAAADKAVWFEFYIPGLTNAFYFTGVPVPLGFGGAEVDSVLEITAYVAPSGNIGWQTAVAPT